jgi:hypothetical protein
VVSVCFSVYEADSAPGGDRRAATKDRNRLNDCANANQTRAETEGAPREVAGDARDEDLQAWV